MTSKNKMPRNEYNAFSESEKKAQDKRDNIEIAQYNIVQCEELLRALESHTGKLVDRRFFEKHFTIEGESRNWTKYSLSNPSYSWQEHKHRIMLDRLSFNFTADKNDCEIVRKYSEYEEILLQNRETAHIVEQINKMIDTQNERIAYNKEQLATLEKIDDNAIKADIIAIYHKYNAPETWGQLLDSYEVKYPKHD